MDPIVFTTKPDPKSLPGFWESKVIPNLEQPITLKKLHIKSSEAHIIENALSANDCKELIRFMESSQNFEEVGVQGMKDKKDERIGSLRTSIWSPGTATHIWSKIKTLIPEFYGHDKKASDWWQYLDKTEYPFLTKNYTPIAVSPLLRFMKYEKGGQHYAHYDAAFIYPNTRYRTLKSVVIYLTTNQGAATRFIEDGQDHISIWDRKHDDWSRPVREEEILGKSECIAGNILIFDHRMCHDVEQYLGNDGPRIIIRGDIVYQGFSDLGFTNKIKKNMESTKIINLRINKDFSHEIFTDANASTIEYKIYNIENKFEKENWFQHVEQLINLGNQNLYNLKCIKINDNLVDVFLGETYFFGIHEYKGDLEISSRTHSPESIRFQKGNVISTFTILKYILKFLTGDVIISLFKNIKHNKYKVTDVTYNYRFNGYKTKQNDSTIFDAIFEIDDMPYFKVECDKNTKEVKFINFLHSEGEHYSNGNEEMTEKFMDDEIAYYTRLKTEIPLIKEFLTNLQKTL